VSRIVDRRNLDFLLYEMLSFQEVLEHPRFEAHDRAAISSMLDVVQSIAETELLPCAADLDAHEPEFADGYVRTSPAAKRALDACATAGFFSVAAPAQWGGLQMPATISLLVNGLLASANLGIANYPFLTIAASNMLSAFGTDAQRAMFLPPMLEGRWFGTMCLSETQAGSSLSDIRTRAEPVDGGGYRLVGSKMWISGGDHELSENIIHMVLARLPDSPPGVKGISLFIVPKIRVDGEGRLREWNNISLAGLNHKMGQRATTNCLLNFGESGDSLGYLVGAPNLGLTYMFHMMNEARIGVGMNSTMSALAGYLFSLEYARTRLQGRRLRDKDPSAEQIAIIEHADVKRMLLFQKAAVEGALALSMYCMMLVDRKAIATDEAQRADLEMLLELLTPIAKSWPSEHCLEANKWAIQVLGGYGYSRDYPVERFYRDNRLNHIHEGTFAIQAIDLLGRKVRLKGGRGLDLLTAEMDQTIAAASGQNRFSREVQLLEQAVQALRGATERVLACDEPDLALANATIYLDSCGQIVVAWLWLKQALAASDALAAGPPPYDLDFYRGKLSACGYFFRYELPRSILSLGLVASLDDTCLRITDTEFIGR